MILIDTKSNQHIQISFEIFYFYALLCNIDVFIMTANYWEDLLRQFPLPYLIPNLNETMNGKFIQQWYSSMVMSTQNHIMSSSSLSFYYFIDIFTFHLRKGQEQYKPTWENI